MKNYSQYTIISFFLAFLFLFTLFLPKWQNLTSLNRAVLEKQSELRSEEKYFQELSKISQDLGKYETSLSKIDSALPETPSLSELLNFIQKAGSQSGLSLKGISPVLTGSPEKRKPKETKLNLILSGYYSDFKNFLSILENSARLIEVENISFSFPKEGPFNFNLTIKVYSY